MIIRESLSGAAHYTPRRGAVWLILSLDGQRYYVFHSQQGRQQLLMNHSANKMSMHTELQQKFYNNVTVLTSDGMTAELKKMSAIGAQTLEAWDMPDFEPWHAEEKLIENWKNCFHHFIRSTGQPPVVAEVFLSHCPCQTQNEIHSTAKTISGIYYPASCYEKLKIFCNTQTPDIKKWAIFYENQFHAQTLDIISGKLKITHRPPHIPLIKSLLG